MSVSHGNDPEILDRIGEALHVEADRVDGIAGTGTSGMAMLVESWAGPDLEAFDADWRGAQQQLAAVAQLLRVVGKRAKEQAQQQREGSGEGGGGRGVPWLSRTPGVDITLPSPGDPALVTPIKYDTPPGGGGDGDFSFGPDGPREPTAEDAIPEEFRVLFDTSFEDGPRIPFESGNNSVPQGLSHFQGLDENGDPVDELVYTFYGKGDTHDGEIVFMDRETGEVTSRVPLEGIDHYGGVTVVGDNTYVSGGGKLQVYETAKLRNPDMTLIDPNTPEWDWMLIDEPFLVTNGARPINYGTTDAEITALADGVPVDASSTVTSYKDSLFVTDFDKHNPSKMYRYEIGPDGRPIPTGDSYDVPPKTQGVSFDEDGNAYFSTSYGRYADSEMVVVPAEDMNAGGWDEDDHHGSDLPKMAEGSVIIDGKLYQLYESGSSAYGAHGPDVLGDVTGATDPRERLTVHDVG